MRSNRRRFTWSSKLVLILVGDEKLAKGWNACDYDCRYHYCDVTTSNNAYALWCSMWYDCLNNGGADAYKLSVPAKSCARLSQWTNNDGCIQSVVSNFWLGWVYIVSWTDKVGGGYIQVDTSRLLHKYSQDTSLKWVSGLTMVTLTMAVIITTTVREKIPININFWRKGMRTCQSKKIGIEMTIHVLNIA